MNDTKCPFCGSEIECAWNNNALYGYDCQLCGNYSISHKAIRFPDSLQRNYDFDKVASYLYYNKKDNYYPLIMTENPLIRPEYLSPKVVDNWYPSTFSERIDMMLDALSKKCSYYGETCVISESEFISLAFLRHIANGDSAKQEKEKKQITFLSDYTYNNNLAIIRQGDGIIKCSILPDGWKRIDELQKSMSSNKNVFVSMSFSKENGDTREAIRKGIKDAGYSEEFMDEIIHNRQIVPEMFRLIRECRFLILEISDPNYGAYYEAGYALGLGKEVIICCSEEVFNKKYTNKTEKKFEKYLKPHFDIAQKQILLWKNHEDFAKKLMEWIKSIIG